MSRPRNYTSKTFKRLFALSGNECAFPGCHVKMVNKNNAKDSNICHIEAANKGGERYNPAMSDAQRADYPNLILLCPQHHDETNNVDKYTVNILKEMKAQHEADIAKRIDPNSINFSVLTEVINKISSVDMDDYKESEIKNVFNAEDKIAHNCVCRNKYIIEEYRVFQGKLNMLFEQIEEHGSIKKSHLLQNIRIFYLEARAKLLGDDLSIENIRRHADDLIDEVENKLRNVVEESSNKNKELSIEALSFGIKIVLVDAFLRCKILEAIDYDK